MFQHYTISRGSWVGSIGHNLICMQRCRRDMPLSALKKLAHLSQSGQLTLGADSSA